MKRSPKTTIAIIGFACISILTAASQGLEPALQGKVDAKIKEAQSWAAETTIVTAVKSHNSGVPADQASMTQDKWKGLSVLDPLVRGFAKNDAAVLLKSKQGSVVTESFLSGSDGTKVAFLSKPTNWSHKGKDKHESPMSGKTWQGPVETDESTGQRQLQVAVPVLDGGKPIGSLVVGLGVSKLEKE